MNEKVVLFLNHSGIQCGVYQYGKRVFDIIKQDPSINYIYKELNNLQGYTTVLKENPTITAIIYNYHNCTMPWLHKSTIQKAVKNIGIPHESNHNMFDIVCDVDPTSSSHYRLPRPLFESIDTNIDDSSPTIQSFIREYTDDDIPIFGSFGFGFGNKGFDKMIRLINEQYDRAIIKIIMPTATFYPDQNISYSTADSCRSIPLKPDVKLMITHEFFSEKALLAFLHSNTMNIFLYDTMHGRSISSTIDYALSVKKPLCISDSHMFRHIYSDSICAYKYSLRECLDNSVQYLRPFLQLYSHASMITTFREILGSIR